MGCTHFSARNRFHAENFDKVKSNRETLHQARFKETEAQDDSQGSKNPEGIRRFV